MLCRKYVSRSCVTNGNEPSSRNGFVPPFPASADDIIMKNYTTFQVSEASHASFQKPSAAALLAWTGSHDHRTRCSKLIMPGGDVRTIFGAKFKAVIFCY